MADFECIEIIKEEKDKFDAFVLQNENGSIHQLSEWSLFQKKIPGRSVVRMFAVKRSQEFLATVLCVQMETGFLGKKWWYSPRGPVFSSKNNNAGQFLMKKVSDLLKQSDSMFWRIDPYQEMFKKNPGISLSSSTQDYQPTDTLEIDLTKSNDELLADMKRKGRYNINLSQKKGVECIGITGKEFKNFSDQKKKDVLDRFWALNTETFARDGFAGHEQSYYGKFLESLPYYAVLFFARFEGADIATAISTFVGEKSIYYFGASTSQNEYRKLMAPYGLQWFMIQWAKKMNCKTYDFLGIAPENKPNHAYAGISEFKWKFGGYRKIYPKGKEVVFNRFWYFIYRLVKKLK